MFDLVLSSDTDEELSQFRGDVEVSMSSTGLDDPLLQIVDMKGREDRQTRDKKGDRTKRDNMKQMLGRTFPF